VSVMLHEWDNQTLGFGCSKRKWSCFGMGCAGKRTCPCEGGISSQQTELSHNCLLSLHSRFLSESSTANRPCTIALPSTHHHSNTQCTCSSSRPFQSYSKWLSVSLLPWTMPLQALQLAHCLCLLSPQPMCLSISAPTVPVVAL
jgi:hypothetical protein